MKTYRFTFVLIAIILSGCAPTILKEVPVGGSVPYKKVVYVENDGRCGSGEVIQIRGGNNSKNIPRKYSCVVRPE